MKGFAAQPLLPFPSTSHGVPMRCLRERVVQSVAFEAGGLVLAAPLYAAVFGASYGESVTLLAAIAVVCMIWCPFHNFAFDWLEARLAGRTASDRPHHWRVVHALSDEASSVVVSLPLLMSFGGLGFAEALLAEVGLSLFYAGYAYLFYLAFDRLRPVVTVR
jgi:uncharacterized membrane protein